MLIKLRIQFIGLRGSGKSYLAKLLATKTNGKVISFANGIYTLAKIILKREISKANAEDRKFLQLLGTDWGRLGGNPPKQIQKIINSNKPAGWGSPDVWVEAFVNNCTQYSTSTSIFNDDTRFLNEIERAVKSLDFIPMFIGCTEETRLKRISKNRNIQDGQYSNHKSEQLVNLLSKRILEEKIMPVLWNDSNESKPEKSWILEKNKILDKINESLSNENFLEVINWTQEEIENILNIM